MAEDQRQRFRRLVQTLADDDRTFLDSSLLGTYKNSLSLGLQKNWLSQSEYNNYLGVGDKRLKVLRGVQLMDAEGNKLTKSVDVQVPTPQGFTTQTKTTPITPLDLLRRTGGQMEGADVDAPTYTGFTLELGEPAQTMYDQRQKTGDIAARGKAAATKLEKERGLTAFDRPQTVPAMLAGMPFGVLSGVSKAVATPVLSTAGRIASAFSPEAGRAVDQFTADTLYSKPELSPSKPFQYGAEVSEIGGSTFAEGALPTVVGGIAGSAAAVPATFAGGPLVGAAAGFGTGLAASVATQQAQNVLGELALGSSYSPSKTGFGLDIQRSPLSQARAEYMQEGRELSPEFTYAGQLATNFLMGRPTLPTGFSGGLKSGLAATKLGTAGREALATAAVPTQGLAGKLASTPFMQGARTAGQQLERIPGVGTAATFGRGFAASAPGREFLSDVAERGVEASSDLAMALQENNQKPEAERDPLWMILGKTALGGLFEGQHKLGTFLNAPGQRAGMAITRGLDARFDTYTPEAYQPIVAPSPFARTPSAGVTPGVTPTPTPSAGGITPTFAEARTATATPRNPLGENVVPIGGGRVVNINPENMSATISNAPVVESDRVGADNPMVGQSLLNAVSSLAPKKGFSIAGTYAKAASTFGKVQTRGDEAQSFLGLTHDGLATVKTTDKKTGESRLDLVSTDMLFGDNQKLAAEAFKAGGITPSDKTGYQLKNYEYDLSRAADYVPSKDGEGPSDTDFNRRIDVVGTPLYGRVVKAIDKNYSVVQVPSPVGGFDMMVVPNDTVEGLSRDSVATKFEGEILDTSSMTVDPSQFRVDRSKYDPIFKASDRERFTGQDHPVLLTPEQVADAKTRKDNLNGYRNKMRSEGVPGGTAQTRLSAASKNTRKEFSKSFSKSDADYEVGSIVEFRTPSGDVDNGVVVGNTQFGPTVVSVSNPMAPAFTVQQSAITRAYGGTTAKPTPEKARRTKSAEAPRPEPATPTAKTKPTPAPKEAGVTPEPRGRTPTKRTKVTEPTAEVTPPVTPTEAPAPTPRRRTRRRAAPVINPIEEETLGEARLRKAEERAAEVDIPVVTPEPTPAPVEPVVVEEPKPSIITEGELLGEADILPAEEGSALDVTMPGDVEMLDDDSLVRITASIEGLGDINDVFRKARNVTELKDILKQVIKDANVKMPASEVDRYADSVSKYYDEWIRAFVNRDLLIAQQYAQGVREFSSTVTSGSLTKYSIDEVPILDTDTKQATKQKLVRNRIARLYQKFEVPRVTNIITMLNEEASKRALVLNPDGTYSRDERVMYFGDALSIDQKREVVRKVQSKLIRERYQTNTPVFAVLSKAPNISAAFDEVFVGEGAYVNIRDKNNDVGQQVVFITMNQADPNTIIEELSHAILENMPVDMAREVATKLGKTLREPTTTNQSIASYEMQEMFAARMKASFLNGENAFIQKQGSAEAKARMTELWDNLRTFMRSAYSEMSSAVVTPLENGKYEVQWAVPYDWRRISLWDNAPVIIDVNGVPVRGKILSTKKYPFGPLLVSKRNLDKPIVAVELYAEDGTSTQTEVTPRDVIALSDDIGMAPEFGKMLLNFVSGSSGPRNIQVIGLDNPYNAVSKALEDNSYAGMTGRITAFSNDVLKEYSTKAASSKPEDVERAAGMLEGIVPNKLLAIVNQANEYGLLSDVSTNGDDSLSLQNWLNVIGTMKAGEGRTRDTFTKQGNRKLTAEKWMRRSLPELQANIADAAPFAAALEAQSRNKRASYNDDAGNTGGNVLYSSRKNPFADKADRALANGQSSTINPDSRTPVDFAESSTRSGVPRESVTPIVQQRVDSDVLRSDLGNSNIKLMEINDVLVIDGTVGINDAGIDTIGKAIDFAIRNNISEALLVTKASPGEEIGYNQKRGYSVEPSVTFEFDGPVTDNVYASMKRMYPYLRKSIDGQSVTLHNVEQRGKTYEESLNDFEKAVGNITSELSKRRIPVQAIQDTERVWHFGNEAAQGYAIPFYEARNVLHLIKPEIYEAGHQSITDQRLRDVIESSLSTVAGRDIKLPGDWTYAQDNQERRLGIASNYDKLPNNSYDTNPDTKMAYDSLMSELDRQFTYLKMTASVDDSQLTGLHKYGKHFLSEPIPPGMVRRVHYTKSKESLDSIIENGIRLSNAKGETYGEPNFVWSNESSLKAYEDMNYKALVEFWEDPSKITANQYQTVDVKPEQIVAVHNGPMSFQLKDLVMEQGLDGAISLLERANLTEFKDKYEPYGEVYQALLEIRAKRDSAQKSKYKLKGKPLTDGHPLMAKSKHKDVNGISLRYIDLLDSIHSTILDSVEVSSGGEHSAFAAFAAHSAITKDVNAIRALYTETFGRSNYKSLGGVDVHKAALSPIEDIKTGIVALDNRIDKTYETTESPFGDLQPNQVNNPMGRVQNVTGRGTPLYSLRPISDAAIKDIDDSDIPTPENPITFADEDGVETTFDDPKEYSTFIKVVQKIDESRFMQVFDAINALGRFPMAGDWSAPLIQNWMLANPIESPDLFFKSLLLGPKSLAPNLGIDNGVGTINKKMFKGREQVHIMGNEIRSNKYYELAKQSRLTLATSQYDRILDDLRAKREEKLAELRKTNPDATLPEIDLMDVDELDVDPDIQGVLSGERYVPLKASSERAMTMMKDYVKFNKFAQAMATYEELGYDTSSAGFKEAASDMAAVLNVMNGDIKFSAQEYDKAIGRMMRRVMFAPRWLASRVMADPIGRYFLGQTDVGKKWMELNGIPSTRSLNPYAFRANWKMLLKARALWFALLAYFGLYRPFDQFKVKTSVGAAGTKIQVGNYAFKAPGGSMMFFEFGDAFANALKMSPKDSPKDAREKFASMMGAVVEGRLVNAPAISILKEMFTGRDFMGKPVGYVDEDLKTWYDNVTKPMLKEIGIDAPEMKFSKLVTKNLMFLWIQSYLETYKAASDREEEDKNFEAAFVGAVNVLGGRLRYNPPAGKGEYDYDTYGNPPGWQYYLLGSDKEEWLINPESELRPDQMEQVEEEVLE
jgi:hypothetical protein